jgi:hypothetical protein
MAQKIFGEALAPGAVVGGDGFFTTVVDVEAGVLPGEQVGEFAGADEFGFAEGVEEAVAVWKRWVRRWRRLRKMPRSTRGMVKTNWRWGTSWQTAVAIQSLVERTRRW